jgi:hypothetical protein
VNNRRFKLVSLKGDATFENGIISFPRTFAPRPMERFYRTSFCSFAAATQTYANCDTNLEYAARRLTNSRFAKVVTARNPRATRQELEDLCEVMEKEYTRNQEVFVIENEAFFLHLAHTLESSVQEYLGRVEENRIHHADPHPKRMPRIHATAELYENGRIWGENWMDSDKRGRPKLPYAVKPQEHAKVGKLPRGIGNLGTHASLAGYRITGALKDEMAREPLRWNGGVFQFVKSPTAVALDNVFERLYDPQGFYFVYHSDDSCVSWTLNGVTRRYNVDITSCDSSHRANGCFVALMKSVPPRVAHDIRILVDQLRATVHINSRSAGHGVRLKTSDNGPFLASGSTLTTFINNVACLGIGLAIQLGNDNSPAGIIAAAKRFGYVITLDEVVDFHGMQFLKNSPVRVDGTWKAFQNIGVLTRLSGQCPGDLPGRGPIVDRALDFQRQLVTSTYSGVSFPLIDRMRAMVGGPSSTVDSQTTAAHQKVIDRILLFKHYDRTDTIVVSPEEAYARYTRVCFLSHDAFSTTTTPNRTCTQAEIDNLHEMVSEMEIGDVIACPAVDVFLNVDYGMDTFIGDPSYQLPHYVREPTAPV